MRLRVLLAGIVAVSSVLCRAETLVTEAKILEVTERGFILKVGTEPLAVEDSPESRLWKNFERVDRRVFQKDDSIGVRIKTDTDPPVLREMADASTWAWLTKLRKEPVKATVEKVEAKTMLVKFPDGKGFEFRISEKTHIELGGKEAGISDLPKGTSVYLKGRLLPTLDTWLEKVSDRPILAKKATTSKKEKPLPPLPSQGDLDGQITAHLSDLKMFDLEFSKRLVHITYRPDTKFFLDGKPSNAGALTKGWRGIVHYSRDKTGRILASKVELFRPTGG